MRPASAPGYARRKAASRVTGESRAAKWVTEHLDALVDQRLSRLLQQAQAGDRVAYEKFLLDARELVRVFLRERLRSSSSLDDVVQETLISIHRSRHSYDPLRPVLPWIRAIALNRLRDFGRARKRREGRASADLDWHNALHPVAMTDTPPLTPLSGALGFLSEAQREVIWLLKIEGYSVAEIAGETGRSAAAIKVMAHRGYRALRTILRPR